MKFAFVSGNLALDLAGTLKWRRDSPEELLATSDDLADWTVAAGVLTDRPEVTASDLPSMLELREAVYRLVTDTAKPGDLDLLNTHAAAPAPTVCVTENSVTRKGNVESVGWAVAWALADLRSERPPMRECGRPECTRIFVDRSRTANRRWCGMQECGNRFKAAAYRARKAP